MLIFQPSNLHCHKRAMAIGRLLFCQNPERFKLQCISKPSNILISVVVFRDGHNNRSYICFPLLINRLLGILF